MKSYFCALPITFSLLLLLLAVACQADGPALPTRIGAVPTLTPVVAVTASEVIPALPPTWTVPAVTAVSLPTTVAPITRTPRPDDTPWPTQTLTPTPTNTATATAVPFETDIPFPSVTVTMPPPPASGANLLPNPSFEEGWYNLHGIPELQVPNHWLLEWDAGHNPLDPDPWNSFVRPESRVLSTNFLPPSEHATFIWDGRHTVKIFKGEGAVSFRMLTDVYLEPGQYHFEAHVFPDLVVGYRADGSKLFAPDVLSGEVRFIVNDGGSGWMLPAFGRKNSFQHVFEISTGQQVRLGVAFRGRWAILNNGWFMDDWSLRRIP